MKRAEYVTVTNGVNVHGLVIKMSPGMQSVSVNLLAEKEMELRVIVDQLHTSVNLLKRSGIRWLHLKLFSAIQV